jgi:hypothetical protein
MIAAVAVVAGGVALHGCGPRDGVLLVSDHLYLDTSRVPCGHDQARIQILQKPPDRTYTRVAYLEAFTTFIGRTEVTWQDLRQELCRQAGLVGADAIIDLRVGSQPVSREVTVGPLEAAARGGGEEAHRRGDPLGLTPAAPGPSG